ncbi:MAG: polysaccharide pyruvyl transferase CsaB [Vampirovibrionales bacterium]|jgi:polysaccharide pyruvyl transferase CsaB
MTPKRLILNGYYGFDNFGDELILLSLSRLFQQYGYELTVLSASPACTRQRYGIGAVHRYNPFQVFVTLLRSHGFISGGGGLLQDSTGPNSVIYYGAMMLLARLFGLKVMHAFTSVGPLNEPFTQKLAGFALNACDFVVVRDEKSAKLVEDLSGQSPMLTADAVWLLPPLDASRHKTPNPMRGQGGSVWKVAVSLRPHHRFSVANQQALAQHLASVLAQASLGLKVELSLVSCEDAMDAPFLLAFEEKLRQVLPLDAQGNISIKHVPQAQALTTFASVHWVVGMRYHALVAALLNQTDVYALDYDPKVQMLASDLGLPVTAVDALETVSSQAFFEGLEHYQAPNLTPLKQAVEAGFSALRILLESSPQG